MIARQVPWLATTSKQVKVLEHKFTRVLSRHTADVVHGWQVQISQLSGHFDPAFDMAYQWMQKDPYSFQAAITVTYLESVFKGEYDRAAKTGIAALKRSPNNRVLRNNISFALAMSGQIYQARTLLPDPLPHPDMYDPVWATEALIEVMDGHVELGLALYDDCIRKANSSDDPELANLVSHYKTLVMLRTGHCKEPSWRASDNMDDPRITLVKVALERELQHCI